MKIIKGRVLQFIDNPFKVEINQACNFFENGAVAINGKYITDINTYSVLSKKYPNAEVFDFHVRVYSQLPRSDDPARFMPWTLFIQKSECYGTLGSVNHANLRC